MIEFDDLPQEAKDVWMEFIRLAHGRKDVVMFLLLMEIAKLRKDKRNA